MSDTTVEHTSFFTNIKNALLALLLSPVLLIGMVVLIFWNEGRSIDRIRTLEAGRGAVVSVSADAPDRANEGALVHLTGTSSAPAYVDDDTFRLGRDALIVSRTVEMYQWKEKKQTRTRETAGGGTTRTTTYSYSKGWSAKPIDSSRFHRSGYRNPQTMEYRSQTAKADGVRVGGFVLGERLAGKLAATETVSLDDAMLDAMPAEVARRFVAVDGRLHDGDASNPRVGDLRVSMKVLSPGPVSVVARQQGDGLVPMKLERGSIALLSQSERSPDRMFDKAESDNTIMTWAIRAGAGLGLFTAFAMFLSPLTRLGHVVPLVGSVVSLGTGLVSGVLAVVVWSAAVAFAWIAVRPVVSWSLFAVAVAAFAFGWWWSRGRRRTAHAPAAA